MNVSIKYLAATILALSPLAVSAQTSDAAYCQALVEKYETYLANMSKGSSPLAEPVDGKMAVGQCKSGNPAGIPVLEQKLRNARIDLPPRG